MTTNQTYRDLVNKMADISSLPPQNFGIFSPWYHRVIPFLKDSPWRMLVFASLFAFIMMYMVFGEMTVRLASFLQFGF